MVELSTTLPPISEKQIAYASKHCFEHKAVKRSYGYVCTHCGATSKTLEKKCPHCGYELKPLETRNRTFQGSEYYAIITKCQEFQVVRIFMVKTSVSIGKSAEYSFDEVIQQWIDTQGRCAYMTLRRAYSYYIDQWNFGSELELRDRNPYGVYDPNPVVYPYKSVISEIKRNGFNGTFHGISPKDFFCAILLDNRIESLLKMGQTEMFREAVWGRGALKYWASILICQRHGYTIDDGRNWVDMMSILDQLGKDLHSPKYIMPTDIKSAHDHWVKKLHEKQNKERVERELREAKEKEAQFKEMKGKFFGVSISENEITISVLESVKDHILEGKALCHCVGHGGYAMRANSLILSAVVNGVKTETIEINLNDMTIAQCRGLQNSNSEYHDRIVDLMKRNIHQIKKRMTA